MKCAGVVATTVLFSLLGVVVPAYTQQHEQDEKHGKSENHDSENQQDKHKQAKQGKQQHAQQQPQDQKGQQQQRAQAQQQQDQENQQQQRAQQQQGERLSQQRQQQLVEQQQKRLTQYREHLDQQQRVMQQQTAQLQQQKRMAQYRFQEEYVERLHEQQIFLQNNRHPDYDRDPYFYTAPIYRYDRGGRYYEANQYVAESLRQAINNGYQEGFRAGAADRQDRWGSNYRDSYAYQDANFGYNGYYVDQDAYNYYFREGFRRGYEDGYSSRYQYGRYSEGNYSVLGAVLSQILKFESLH
jgi:hypothetical protein